MHVRSEREALLAVEIILPNIADLPDAITKDGPSLAILEHDPPRLDGIRLCRAIRRQAPEHRLAVLMVAREDNQDAGTAADVSDWLIKPFTVACARTKIRTWLLRAAGGAMERAGDAERREAAKPRECSLGSHRCCREFHLLAEI